MMHVHVQSRGSVLRSQSLIMLSAKQKSKEFPSVCHSATLERNGLRSFLFSVYLFHSSQFRLQDNLEPSSVHFTKSEYLSFEF